MDPSCGQDDQMFEPTVGVGLLATPQLHFGPDQRVRVGPEPQDVVVLRVPAQGNCCGPVQRRVHQTIGAPQRERGQGGRSPRSCDPGNESQLQTARGGRFV
uniref:Uncharacterized protein n=1 Tax=Cacopsylla melanoneura TaxID=428564 RepID=A0A8D9F6S4_9HEMI